MTSEATMAGIVDGSLGNGTSSTSLHVNEDVPMDTAASTNLTEEEATRYDRQMRLWGIEAQQRYVLHSSLCLWASLLRVQSRFSRFRRSHGGTLRLFTSI